MESKELEAKIRALRTKRGKNANFNKWAAFHIDDLMALVTAEVERAKAELEALLLGEDAPSDRSGVRLYQDDKDSKEYWTCKECGGYDECDCSGFNDSNTAWRQHIRNKLGSKGQDNE